MSLTGALGTTLSGLQNTESRISVLSGNVSNADKPGYTKKVLSTDYTTVNGQTVALSSSIEISNYNPFLLKTLIEDTSIAARSSTIAEYLSDFSREIGTIDSDGTISALTNNLITALDRLAVSPEDPSLKNLVVQNASRVAVELNRLSESAQASRSQADLEIETAVGQINDSVSKIAELNEKIVVAQTIGVTTANLEDDRRVELEKLSELISVDYFINNQGRMQLYTNGRPLLDSRAREITYVANTALDKTVLYPAGFNAIDLDGYDLTPRLSGGKIGGLVSVRDTFLVQEQSKLDEFANVLITQMNALTNSGASIPAPSDIIGERLGLSAATPFSATGSIRIATTDNAGVVQNFADIPLGAMTTVGDLITAINLALGPDVTASIATPNGELRLVANNAGEGISFNQLTSNVTPDNVGLSQYFGLNNLFDGTGSDDIEISQYLVNNPSNLATSRLTSGALAIGDTGIFIGDGSLSIEMKNSFGTTTSFNAAGNFPTQTETLTNYINKFIGDIALRASNERSNADISISLMDQTKTTLQNISGVNIDEELANLIDLEAKYEASATMLSTIQKMFETLTNAIR